MASGTSRGITVGGVIHRPVRGGKTSGAGAGDGVALFAGKAGRNMVGWFDYDPRIAGGMTRGTTRSDTGMAHSPAGKSGVSVASITVVTCWNRDMSH